MKATPLGVCLAAVAMICVPACKNDDDLTTIRPGTVFVAARDSFFLPDTVTIAVGLPVRWTNEGTAYHTVAADNGLWTSNLLAPTWWFEVRFDSAGTFPYHCSRHEGMTGTVIAQ